MIYISAVGRLRAAREAAWRRNDGVYSPGPAGAVLGHRALVGVTVSYFVIVVLIVGLVVWAALPTANQTPSDTAQKSTAISSPPTSSSVTTSASPTPPPAPTSPSAPPPPVTRDAIAGVLLNGEDFGKILGEPFEPAPTQPAKIGGLDEMPNGLPTEADASPHECVAATSIAQRSTYQSANVTAYAAEDWQTDGGDAVIAVYEAVVALPTAADAQALFSSLSEQWRRCEGQTVTVLAGPAPAR
jgi:cytoskeletal protein RodZ